MQVQVIGGGVVGLAVARRLAEREGGQTLVIERHEGVGRESSSRNSEVGFSLEGRGLGEALARTEDCEG